MLALILLKAQLRIAVHAIMVRQTIINDGKSSLFQLGLYVEIVLRFSWIEL
nr:hypothetical protein Iba_chr01aCG20650 [Ipomoea batatas]